MLFSSLIFLFVFLPVVLVTYQALVQPSMMGGRRAGWWRQLSNLQLLIASLGFYAWGEIRLLWIMLTMILVNYVCGLGIARSRAILTAKGVSAKGRGRRWLALSLAADLGLLAYFKYANFGVENFNLLASWIGLDALLVHDFVHVALPLGISFYTFQSMSYTIDVYRGEVAATRNLIDFGCYVSMFPQLVAGPIVRYVDVAEELVDRRVTLDDFAAGAMRFCVGLAKKVLIANAVAVPADAIFALPTDQVSMSSAWFGVVCYTLQIYFDFSAYSDMAIGLGRMFGFHFIENFRYPYVARSNQEFWRRWHISLSTWFRDYLYIPLGGNKGRPFRTYLNLVLVFFLCGLWHGASWTFVVWGLYHGLFLILERRFLQKLLTRSWRPLQHGYLLLVALGGWVLFRSDTMGQAGAFFVAMAGCGAGHSSIGHLLDPDTLLALVFGGLFAAPVAPAFVAAWRRRQEARVGLQPVAMEVISMVVRPVLIIVLFSCCVMVLSAGTHNPFIYFRF